MKWRKFHQIHFLLLLFLSIKCKSQEINDSRCGPGWKFFEIDYKCYKIFSIPLRLGEAETACHLMDSQLIDVDSEQKEKFILDFLINDTVSYPGGRCNLPQEEVFLNLDRHFFFFISENSNISTLEYPTQSRCKVIFPRHCSDWTTHATFVSCARKHRSICQKLPIEEGNPIYGPNSSERMLLIVSFLFYLLLCVFTLGILFFSMRNTRKNGELLLRMDELLKSMDKFLETLVIPDRVFEPFTKQIGARFEEIVKEKENDMDAANPIALLQVKKRKIRNFGDVVTAIQMRPEAADVAQKRASDEPIGTKKGSDEPDTKKTSHENLKTSKPAETDNLKTPISIHTNENNEKGETDEKKKGTTEEHNHYENLEPSPNKAPNDEVVHVSASGVDVRKQTSTPGSNENHRKRSSSAEGGDENAPANVVKKVKPRSKASAGYENLENLN